MQIQVIEVTRGRDGALRVAFQCDRGGATARWRGGTRVPESGKFYGVELDVDATIDLSTNARTIAATDTMILAIRDTVLLRVAVESVDDDGMGFMRLSGDCLIMMDTTGSVVVGSVIEIQVPENVVSVTAIGGL